MPVIKISAECRHCVRRFGGTPNNNSDGARISKVVCSAKSVIVWHGFCIGGFGACRFFRLGRYSHGGSLFSWDDNETDDR